MLGPILPTYLAREQFPPRLPAFHGGLSGAIFGGGCAHEFRSPGGDRGLIPRLQRLDRRRLVGGSCLQVVDGLGEGRHLDVLRGEL